MRIRSIESTRHDEPCGTRPNIRVILNQTSSVLVHADVQEQFLQHVQEHVAALKADPESPVLRGLFSTASALRVDALISDAIERGARIAAGERKITGNVLQPVVLADVTSGMSTHCSGKSPYHLLTQSDIFREELFGPVFSVVSFEDEIEAIRIVNGLDYGLSSAVFSQDVQRAYKLARRLQYGAVGDIVNCFAI